MTPGAVVPVGRRRVLLSGYRGVIALRWVGVVLLVVAALTTPDSQWPAGSVAVAAIASGYNLAAMVQQRRGEVPRGVRWALLGADFVGCMVVMLSMLSTKSLGSGPIESIGLLVIGVEAVVLFDWQPSLAGPCEPSDSSACCCWTSTASRWSTTRSVTTSATAS
jgi:hypothetical protein